MEAIAATRPHTSSPIAAADLPALKTRQQAAWSSGDPAGQADLERDLLQLIARFNRAGDGSMVVPSDYLAIVITRR